MELSIKEIIDLIYKRLKLILLLTFIGAGVLFTINKYVRKPIYTASVQLYVNPNDGSSTAGLNELNYAQKVVATYINLLRTNTFYSRVLEETGLDYTEQQLRAMTNIQTVNNTEIFQISVYSNDASDSYQLVEAMQYIAPQLISNIKDNAKISVVDPVVFPEQPSGPNIILNTVLGAMSGFFLAIILSFLWELINVKVKSKEELMKRYDIPILGVIPNFDGMISNKQRLLQKLPLVKKTRANYQLYQMTDQKSNFIITEAYKSLRTNLLYAIRKKSCKKILINSPTPEEGKSTTCTNIAVAIAQTGARVLLIDCDIRRGRLHRVFNLKSTPGLTNILGGMKTENEVIQYTSYDNLNVITSGSVAPNPTELLASFHMEELIKNLEKNYDYIILDSAPVNLVSDALSLAKLVDGVLVVVRENTTTYPNIDAALDKYELIEGRVLGFVLNGASLMQGSNSKSKYYYYHNKDD
jgi:capsular exopolysaccharide synthesis family protein